MMTATGRRGVIVVMMMVMMVVMGSWDHGRWISREPCQQMREECRLKTFETDAGVVSRNVSCFCKYGEEVSHLLERLVSARCMNAFGVLVNVSILHIVGCNVTLQAPLQSLLATLRETSGHLELYVERSGWLSLASPSFSSSRPSSIDTPNSITATFLNSNISGIPEAIVSGASVSASFAMEGCEVGVLETRAFSGYAPNAQVTVAFRDTSILTVQQGAFDLPREAQVEMRGGLVLNFERYSYSGGAELTLDSVRGAKLLESAINIYGLKKLSITNCTIAAVYYHALEHRPPTYVRNITWGNTVTEGSEATFFGNKFLEGNGEAFAQLCSIAKITWHNNTVLVTDDMPLRLQAPECSTKRDWPLVFSSNKLRCERCTDFTNPDSQTCALFASSYCISCKTALDSCGEPVLPYITSKCQTSHPDVAKALSDTCRAATTTTGSRTPKALQAQGSGSSAASLTPLALGVALSLPVLLHVGV